MKKLILFLAMFTAAQSQTPVQPAVMPSVPEIPANLTIAQLSAVIESQSLTIQRLQARVNELERGSQVMGALADNLAKMKAICTAKDSTLAVNPQSGLYLPDKDGKPYCVANTKKTEVKPADGDKN